MWQNSFLILGSLVCLVQTKEFSLKPIVNATKTDYWISFDDKRINGVLFYAEKDKTCPGKYVYAFNSSLSHPWVMQDQLNTTLKENKVRLQAVVDASNKLYSQSFNITINPNNAESNTISNVINNKNTQVNTPICAKLKQQIKNPKKTCISTETEMEATTSKAPKCSGELIFNSNFEDTIDYRMWKHHSCFPKKSVVFYTNNTATSYITGKHLYLNITNTIKSPPYNKLLKCHPTEPALPRTNEISRSLYSRIYGTVKMDTNNTFSFKYGKIDIRAKMPIGDWLVPIIELTSKHNSNLTILVAYTRGNLNLRSTENREIGGKTVFGGVKYYKENPLVDKLFPQHNGYHFNTYTVIWHPDRIIYKVNGTIYGTITDKRILSELQKDECFITLGINAGSPEDFPHQTIHRDFKKIDEPKNYVNFDNKNANVKFKLMKIFWKQPELIIESIKVYSTHYLEE